MRNSTVDNHNMNFHNRPVKEKKNNVRKVLFSTNWSGQGLLVIAFGLQKLGGSPIAANLLSVTCAVGCRGLICWRSPNATGDAPQKDHKASTWSHACGDLSSCQGRR